ncbi:hypothetical protein BLJ79_04370 [Arthrobacter sp. UCD-GKA]|uniref:hypothetical protein n=1 Tax=Arthrobacter sp. UCD-GKA TaxID=1913576 RepID=UPI0008DD2294|nr:hypothetical protein [Arthrobacter sp. UCD-GKA]OIH86037.1 hypothetical protein BLJ79_04370 [Arthrobacter sp. UCD-GKA]
MSYFLAQSLAQLRSQVNALWPNRDKKSDGWIGDASHNARKSDHNPDYSDGGIVRALDIDKDGIDVEALLSAVVGEPRVAYVIWNRRIWTHAKGWQPYSGANPHTGHIHVSIRHTAAAAAGGAWSLGAGTVGPVATPSAPAVQPSTGGGSVVDWLNGKGRDSSYAARAKLATQYGIRGYKGTADQNTALLAKLKAGVPAPAVKPKPAPAKPKTAGKTVAQMAAEVRAGKHGNGHDVRRKSLGISAAEYAKVRDAVNGKSEGKSVADMATEVIQGKHGNGHPARQQSLGVNAATYAKVRAAVNKRA